MLFVDMLTTHYIYRGRELKMDLKALQIQANKEANKRASQANVSLKICTVTQENTC